jgi:hypothetical protein
MLILNCTKAAADFFSRAQKGKKISPLEAAPKKTIAESIADSIATTNAPRQWQWLVHAIKVKGKNVLVVMDYHSRFSISLCELKKGRDSSFLDSFEHHLTVHVHEMMTAINASPEAIDSSLQRYRHQHNSSAFYLRGDRSMQTHINDVIWHFRNWADVRGVLPTKVDLIGQDFFVNQLLRRRKTKKDYFTPQNEFLHAWLTHYGEYSMAQADSSIARLKAKERADFAAKHPDLFPSSEPQNISVTPDTDTGFGNNVISLDAYRKK